MSKDISILVVTHFSKTKQFSQDDPFERISGTTGLFGVSDVAWIIYGKRGQEQTLRITGRDAVDGEFRIVLEGCRWRMLGDSEALQEQRRIDAYRASKIAETIRALVEKNGRWQGKAGDLKDEVIRRTGTMPTMSEKEIGKKLAAIEEMLLKIDGIMVSKGSGGRAGRGYTFERTISKIV